MSERSIAEWEAIREERLKEAEKEEQKRFRARAVSKKMYAAIKKNSKLDNWVG